MRWFLLPSEAHAIMRGENPCKNNNTDYIPMFYPRSDDALKGHNKLNRTRLKSGLANVKFCNCPRQMHRHVKNRDCIPEQQRGNTENKENKPVLDSEKTIVYDLDDKMNVVAPLKMKSNGHLASKQTNGHISNGNGHLPGQVWDLDIEKS